MNLIPRISYIREKIGLERLDIVIDSKFSSKVSDYRLALRRALAAATGESDQKVMDLSRPPLFEKIDVSISHCPMIGGYLLVDKPWTCGFDIEIAKRVDLKHIEKLSQKSELEVLSEPAALWAAKEAAFKAFSKAHNITLASEAIIMSAAPANFSMIEFEAQPMNKKTSGLGCIISENDLKIALFFYRGI